MGTLTVVRHGQASMLSADYDRLSELGQDQARQLGDWWAQRSVDFDAVYSGPARRHITTAAGVQKAIAAAGRSWDEATVVSGLDEHDAFAMVNKVAPTLAGDPSVAQMLEALQAATTRDERSASFQRLFQMIMERWLVGDVDAPDIETWPAFRRRVDAAVDLMLAAAPATGSRIVAFSSVGPLAVMLRRALATADLRSFETAWRLRNASVTTFVFGRGRFTLDSFNVVEHLEDPAHHTFR